MSVDPDEIETTRGEKLLAVVLTAFLLVGTGWVYSKLDRDRLRTYEPPAVSAADQAAIDRYREAQQSQARTASEAAVARSTLELRREAYRTALDAGQPSGALERDYRAAEQQFASAQRAAAEAQTELAAAEPGGRAAYTRRDRAARDRDNGAARTTFLLRVGFSLLLLAGSFAAFARLRATRWFPVAAALVATATLMTLFLAADYLNDYIRWQDLGPLVLSLAGIALTLGAFVALQRYLATRIPLRRVRRAECPYCGFPARGNAYCEGCGHDLVAPCPACGSPRRVGVAHCGACGAS